MATRATTISVTKLSAAIDKAVADAVARQKIDLVSGNATLTRWELLGRRIKGGDLVAAQEFASAVTARVAKSGFKVEPVTVVLGKGGVLAGFFPVSTRTDLSF